MTLRSFIGLAPLLLAACGQTADSNSTDTSPTNEQRAEKALQTGARAVVMQAAKTPVRVATAAVTVGEKIENKLENKPTDSSETQ